MREPEDEKRSEPAKPRREPVPTDHPDDRVIEAHLRLTPAERLQALQSFVEDVIRMRDGRRPAIR